MRSPLAEPPDGRESEKGIWLAGGPHPRRQGLRRSGRLARLTWITGPAGAAPWEAPRGVGSGRYGVALPPQLISQ